MQVRPIKQTLFCLTCIGFLHVSAFAQLVQGSESTQNTPLGRQPTEQAAQRQPFCHVMVLPRTPREAVVQGISGRVVARMPVAKGEVQDVEIVSGPSIFSEVVVSAMKQYKCAYIEEPVFAVQEFVFNVPALAAPAGIASGPAL